MDENNNQGMNGQYGNQNFNQGMNGQYGNPNAAQGMNGQYVDPNAAQGMNGQYDPNAYQEMNGQYMDSNAGQFANPNQGAAYNPNEEQKASGESTAAMVLGIVGLILSLVCCCLWYGEILAILLDILAIAFGCHAQKAGKNNYAKAGIITGIIGLVIAILICILGVIGTIIIANDSSSSSSYNSMMNSFSKYLD